MFVLGTFYPHVLLLSLKVQFTVGNFSCAGRHKPKKIYLTIYKIIIIIGQEPAWSWNTRKVERVQEPKINIYSYCI